MPLRGHTFSSIVITEIICKITEIYLKKENHLFKKKQKNDLRML